MLHIISTLVLLIIIAGMRLRKYTKVHMALMGSAFVIDLLLVLYIEFSRKAVETVVSTSAKPIIYIHALISLTVLGCYVGMFVLGRRTLAGKPAAKAAHRNLGITFCLFRAANYATAFLL